MDIRRCIEASEAEHSGFEALPHRRYHHEHPDSSSSSSSSCVGGGGGLAQFESSPLLAGLFDEEEDLFFQGDPAVKAQSELARFFSDDDLGFTSLLTHSGPSPFHHVPEAPTRHFKGMVAPSRNQHQHSPSPVRGAHPQDANSAGYDHHLSKPRDQKPACPLPVISEHHHESVNNFYTESSCSASSDLTSEEPCVPLAMPPSTSPSPMPALAKHGLLRHSSSPADFLSRLVVEDCSQRPLPHFSSMQTISENMPAGTNHGLKRHGAYATTGLVQAMPTNSCNPEEKAQWPSPEVCGAGLIRQSSSPAGMLSQIVLDGVSSTGSSPEDIGFDARAAAVIFSNQTMAVWDEVASRKRGRLMDSAMIPRVQQNYGGAPQTSTNHAEGYSLDAVLCKTRAKRGCATHPRSIAERLRRTKITDGIKRLQELLPNMDKQINTSEMLDEAVEYIKLLKREAQELSEKQRKCDGMCQKKRDM